MAPCVIIGERAAELLRTTHKLSGVEAYSDQEAALRKRDYGEGASRQRKMRKMKAELARGLGENGHKTSTQIVGEALDSTALPFFTNEAGSMLRYSNSNPQSATSCMACAAFGSPSVPCKLSLRASGPRNPRSCTGHKGIRIEWR
jgi:hypothetical protein